jgi:dihydrofolate synthase / folylpolyglutamate synthase
MTYAEATESLYELRLFGARLGLSNTQRLAELAGALHQQLQFIHVAGTNGKGSTCAMLESIYRAGGLRVGLYTSPHLVSFRERIQVNRQLISETDVVRLVTKLQRLLRQFPDAEHPTFFEVTTVMALSYFATQACDLVIWETGLGGRLDATNIVTPLASVITNVQYDHQKWLGPTLSSIASEKAGIIKPGVPVLTACLEKEALRVITSTALERNAPLTVVTEADIRIPPLATLQLPLRGQHQRLNAALAVATVRALARRFALSESALIAGLKQVEWPGRLQVLIQPSGSRIVLDGAHNLAGAEALVAAWREEFSETKPALILGILQDKDIFEMTRVLAPLANRILLVPVGSHRTADPSEVQAGCRQTNPSAKMLICDSLAHALELTADEPFVLVTGSLYLVGEALQRLQNLTTGVASDLRLNEWDAPSNFRPSQKNSAL